MRECGVQLGSYPCPRAVGCVTLNTQGAEGNRKLVSNLLRTRSLRYRIATYFSPRVFSLYILQQEMLLHTNGSASTCAVAFQQIRYLTEVVKFRFSVSI